jgi:hypothetical protein
VAAGETAGVEGLPGSLLMGRGFINRKANIHTRAAVSDADNAKARMRRQVAKIGMRRLGLQCGKAWFML